MDRGSNRSWLFGLQKLGMKLGLDNCRRLCSLLGGPQNSFISLLVAGTNGKGSVASMLDAILQRAGHRTGLYTSPHLVRPEERIRIHGADIGEPVFDETLSRVRETAERYAGSSSLPRMPTYFECLTAMAFDAFARAGIEVAVLEVGLGGRFDATNVVEPALSLVSSVDLDHQEHLGSDLASIAGEKAGVFRRGRPALCGERKPAPRAALQRVARALEARFVYVPSEVRAVVRDDGMTPPRTPDEAETCRLRMDLITPLRRYSDLSIPLPGRHQARNASLAVRAAELFCEDTPLPADAVRFGLPETRWPGRLEWIAGSPPMLLDCAHNPAGAAVLASALGRIRPRRRVLVFGAMHDKDFAGMASVLAPVVTDVVGTQPRLERAAPAEEVLAPFLSASTELRATAIRDVSEAIASARDKAGSDGIVCVAGSIFLVGEAKELLKGRAALC